jgi:GNAT superfamily N-acetyltransferase
MIELARPEADDLETLRRIYTASFPTDEQRPWQLVVTPRLPGCPALYAIVSNGATVGLITLWQLAEVCYVEHFAVAPELRGTGIGSACMALVTAQYGCVVLEVEPPQDGDSEADRRIWFYERCGLHLLDYDYTQPPYTPQSRPVKLRLMASAHIDTARVAAILHREVYGVTTKKQVF